MTSRFRGPDREAMIALGLAVFAALRVAVFAAAFPLFSNVDEHKHIDMVLKHARGYLSEPGGDAFEAETGRYLGLYGTPEYLLEAERVAPPPAWARDAPSRLAKIERSQAFLATRPNKEAHQPPAYYAAAGAWLRAGRALGLTGGEMLYWVRGLNALASFLLVIVAYRFLRDTTADDAFVRLAVPALLAVVPMDSLYYVTPDALSPLLAGAGFCLAVRLALRPAAGVAPYAVAGLVGAAAFLTKFTNAAVLVVFAGCTAAAWAQRPNARALRSEAKGWLLLWLLAALPIAAWLVRNQLLFGEFTVTSLKVERLGWGTKSLGEYWDHPILTPSGFAVFVTDLVPKFWRGELAWHRLELADRGADLFYTVSTLLGLGLAALGLTRRRRNPGERFAEGMAFAMLLVAAATLGALSLMYVFNETSNPPAHRPYFVHGRLISGALLPFALLYARGIEVATSGLPGRWARRAAWGCVAVVALVVLVSEIGLSSPVFTSEYNLFHMP